MNIVGIDEVGRGCLAGPVVAGAVILGKDISGLKDSKLLSRSKREYLSPIICSSSKAWAIGWASNTEIDSFGLTEAVRLAMRRALKQIEINYEAIIIDGNYNFLRENSLSKAVIKADQTVPAVSAASIIAKVERDKYMRNLSPKFPNYGFEKNVGYGTALHLEQLKLKGVCSLHRLSFKPNSLSVVNNGN
jgi:ribonuclease HII